MQRLHDRKLRYKRYLRFKRRKRSFHRRRSFMSFNNPGLFDIVDVLNSVKRKIPDDIPPVVPPKVPVTTPGPVIPQIPKPVVPAVVDRGPQIAKPPVKSVAEMAYELRNRFSFNSFLKKPLFNKRFHAKSKLPVEEFRDSRGNIYDIPSLSDPSRGKRFGLIGFVKFGNRLHAIDVAHGTVLNDDLPDFEGPHRNASWRDGWLDLYEFNVSDPSKYAWLGSVIGNKAGSPFFMPSNKVSLSFSKWVIDHAQLPFFKGDIQFVNHQFTNESDIRRAMENGNNSGPVLNNGDSPVIDHVNGSDDVDFVRDEL